MAVCLGCLHLTFLTRCVVVRLAKPSSDFIFDFATAGGDGAMHTRLHAADAPCDYLRAAGGIPPALVRTRGGRSRRGLGVLECRAASASRAVLAGNYAG